MRQSEDLTQLVDQRFTLIE